jgi:hypothetical protein
MSRKPRRVTLGRLPANQRSFEPWLKDARPDVEIHRDLLQRLAGNRFGELPREIASFLDAVAKSCVKVYWPAKAGKRTTLTKQEVASVVRRAVHEGYLAALIEYSADIQVGDEAATLYDKRDTGVHKGHETQARIAGDKAQAIRDKWAEMESAGLKPTNDTVAAAVGCSRSTVIRAFKSRNVVPARPSLRRNR